MHELMLKRIIEVCRQRQQEGDCPTVKAASVEQLEDAVVMLAAPPAVPAQAPDELSGTYVCPVCGKDTPHAHDKARQWSMRAMPNNEWRFIDSETGEEISALNAMIEHNAMVKGAAASQVEALRQEIGEAISRGVVLARPVTEVVDTVVAIAIAALRGRP